LAARQKTQRRISSRTVRAALLKAGLACPLMAHSCPRRLRRHVRSWRKPTPHSKGASVGQPTEPCLAPLLLALPAHRRAHLRLGHVFDGPLLYGASVPLQPHAADMREHGWAVIRQNEPDGSPLGPALASRRMRSISGRSRRQRTNVWRGPHPPARVHCISR
jgi:hypothetical protein